MKIWSKLNYILMWAAIIFAAVGMALAIYSGKDWNWQFGTMVWAFVAYLNQKTADRFEAKLMSINDSFNKEIDRIVDESKQLLEENKTK